METMTFQDFVELTRIPMRKAKERKEVEKARLEFLRETDKEAYIKEVDNSMLKAIAWAGSLENWADR